MPPAGFEPTVPASKQPQTNALDSQATGTGQDLSLRPNKFMVSTQPKYQLLANSRNRIL